MIKNPYYRLEYIADVPYLLAFGQANADFKRDVQLNETGAFLWENFDRAPDIAGLAKLCAEHFECTTEQKALLTDTVRSFLNTLLQKRILLDENASNPMVPFYQSLEIAGLFCRLFGPKEAFAPELSSFTTDKQFPDGTNVQEVRICTGSPTHRENGVLLVRDKDLIISRSTNGYILLFPRFSFVEEMHIREDGCVVNIYCLSQFTPEEVQEISYAMRIAFLYLAQLCGMLAIHSSSILYRDKAWLFAAPSGTGKTTHTELWKHLLHTPVINGDLNLVALRGGQPLVHGIPWCGTSAIYDTNTYPLGGIVLLERGRENSVRSLSEDRGQLCVLHRNVSPSWTAEMHAENYQVVKSLSEQILICKLFCTPDESAVACIREQIDKFLEIP